MKHYYIYKEDNDFTDILGDPIIKKITRTKLTWLQHIILGFSDDVDEGTISYFVLKYGEHIVQPSSLIPDRTPVMNVDYRPNKVWMNGRYVDN